MLQTLLKNGVNPKLNNHKLKDSLLLVILFPVDFLIAKCTIKKETKNVLSRYRDATKLILGEDISRPYSSLPILNLFLPSAPSSEYLRKKSARISSSIKALEDFVQLTAADPLLPKIFTIKL
jgi:hypothetical protein